MSQKGGALLVRNTENEASMTFVINELEKHIEEITEKISLTEKENEELMARASFLQSKLAEMNQECVTRQNDMTKGLVRSLENICGSGKGIKDGLKNYSKFQKEVNNEIFSKCEKPYGTQEQEPEPISDDLALSVERTVDSDGLLVSWKPSLKSISEYKIFVNGILHQRLYPSALKSTGNKVLIQPLNLNEPVSISLNAVYEGGDTTKAAVIEYHS